MLTWLRLGEHLLFRLNEFYGELPSSILKEYLSCLMKHCQQW